MTVAELAKFNPDLILAGYLGSEDQYNKLKEIAPTIPVLTKGATADTWEQLTTTAGKMFGVGDQAQKLIDATNGEISTFKSNNAKRRARPSPSRRWARPVRSGRSTPPRMPLRA